MGKITYFYDTYAFLEIIKGNPKYYDYASNHGIMTAKLNIMELYYTLLRTEGLKRAEHFFASFDKFVVKINDSLIKEAMVFKLKNKDKKLSYVDCIGYIFSRRLNIKFLTGDNGFKELENVEFVK
ncbi:MAG: PIN domain-containing protein [Candidatus Woesearchaeota archaeon]